MGEGSSLLWEGAVDVLWLASADGWNIWERELGSGEWVSR
jgi:hypothetical protein